MAIKHRLKRYFVLIVCILPIYFVVMIFGGCADKLLLHPTTNQIPVHRAKQRWVELNGKKLEIWTARSADGRPPEAYVVEYCGNATRAEQIVEYVADRWSNVRPVEVWVLNYPGYGGSEGGASL